MAKQAKTRRWFQLAIFIAVAAFLLVAADAAWACPNCKEGLAQNDPHGQSVAAGYYYSILFMMAMPYIILTTLGGFAYRAVKKAQVQRNAAAETSALK